MSCFKCSINLCEILVDCDNKATININQAAPVTGNYQLLLNFLDVKLIFEKSFVENENLIFCVNNINENFCYDFKILKDNEVLYFNVDSKIYNSFKFCTKQWKNTSL
jgi:hypothetical protein